MVTHYDYIFCGGGISAVTIAHNILQKKSLKEKKILILEKETDPHHYNISFWATSLPIACIPVKKKWKKIGFQFPSNLKKVLSLHRYIVYSFFSDEYIYTIKEKLMQHSNVEWLKSTVIDIKENKQSVTVVTESGICFTAEFVFDSTSIGKNTKKTTPYKGITCFVESARPIFDPTIITLFDFNSTQSHSNFLYHQPFTNKKSIVEFVSFRNTPNLLQAKKWLKHAFPELSLTITAQPGNWASLIDEKKIKNSRIVPIGLKAGNMRYATGYAYTNIVKHSGNIVEALRKGYSPQIRVTRPFFYQILDSAFIFFIQTVPQFIVIFLQRICSYSSGDAILDYLDAKLTLKQITKLPLSK